VTIRPATPDDLDFLTWVDLEDEGVTPVKVNFGPASESGTPQSPNLSPPRERSVKLRHEAEPGEREETEHEKVPTGVTPGYRNAWTEADFAEHRKKIAAFVTDPDHGGRVLAGPAGDRLGAILWRYRNRFTEDFPAGYVFLDIPAEVFPPDGRFCEIFNLWVAPTHRRQGHATALKQAAESDAKERGVALIYTHTEATNDHVLTLNANLGYKEVRRGPIWDEVIQVGLVKNLH
jgi:ribosomal protein S18 acetylase RimI-like enzyme